MTKHSPHDVEYAVSLFFAVRRAIRSELAKGDMLDPSAWLRVETLKFIKDNDNPLMKEFADYFSITAPSATSLVSGLVKDGLVVHRIDPRDHRASRLKLTKKGEVVFKRTVARGVKLLSGLFAGLPDAEFTAFIGALEHIKKRA